MNKLVLFDVDGVLVSNNPSNVPSISGEVVKRVFGLEIIRDADKLDFLSILRWKNVIEKKHSTYLAPFAKKVPHLRNEMLSLDVSKKLYDEMLVELKSYLKKCPEWGELDRVKEVVFAL